MSSINCELSWPLKPQWAASIEAYLFETEYSAWSLHEDVLNHQFVLIGYFPSNDEGFLAWETLREAFSFLPEKPHARDIDNKSWQEAYKVYLKPWQSRCLHWIPVWDWKDYHLPAGATAVRLDPGMAFGTGSHETTRLVAERLLDLKENLESLLSQTTVLDAGCGSGILALSAHLLGFGKTEGFDIDPEAVRISKEHLALNGLKDDAVTFYTAGLPDGLKGKTGDIVLANIQAEVLIPYAEALLKATNKKGTLILSGILAKEIDDVRSAYVKAGDSLQLSPVFDSRIMGEWADLAIKL